jgi:hypothetical protein
VLAEIPPQHWQWEPVFASIKSVKVKMLRRAIGNVGGVSLRHYREGHVYDLPPTLANYLVAQRLAMFEMRNEDRKTPVEVERRRKP